MQNINLAVEVKIRQTWKKLNFSDLTHYVTARTSFISILAGKYNLTRQQAEDTLDAIERITHASCDSAIDLR